MFDPALLATFFGCYASFAPPHTQQVMECLSYLVAIRRSVFNDRERTPYVAAILQHTSTVMRNTTGMGDVGNYHEFCKMLCRFKLTYPLTELSDCATYGDWIQLVSQFTVQGFQSWQWSPNSISYLLMFWSKMVVAMGNKNDDHAAAELCALTARVTVAFIQSKLESVVIVRAQGLDGVPRVCLHCGANADQRELFPPDPLEDEDALTSSLELLATFARKSYEQCAEYVRSSFLALLTVCAVAMCCMMCTLLIVAIACRTCRGCKTRDSKMR